MIVCLPHHRIIHNVKEVSNKSEKTIEYDNGIKDYLKLVKEILFNLLTLIRRIVVLKYLILFKMGRIINFNFIWFN